MQHSNYNGENSGPYSNYTNLYSGSVPLTKQSSFKKLKSTNQNHHKIIKVEGGTVSDYSQDAAARTIKNVSIKNMFAVDDSVEQPLQEPNPSFGCDNENKECI